MRMLKPEERFELNLMVAEANGSPRDYTEQKCRISTLIALAHQQRSIRVIRGDVASSYISHWGSKALRIDAIIRGLGGGR